MLQRDFGYRIYKALASFPAKDEKKEKKGRREADRKEVEKREIKKEKEEESEEPAAKKSKDEDEEKRKVAFKTLRVIFNKCLLSESNIISYVFFLKQYDDKTIKKEESRDEDENEDEGSTANAEEYDPLEAEDADDDDDDDDGNYPSFFLFCLNAKPLYSVFNFCVLLNMTP